MAKLKKSIGINELLEVQFNSLEFTDEWLKLFGKPEHNFKMLVYGDPKHGKTDTCIAFAKYLSQFGMVYYNSYEQGKSKSLQDAVKRNRLDEVAGRVMFGNKDSFEDMKLKLKTNRSKFVFIDSRDYMNLTLENFKELTTMFPKKSFIVICWEKSGKPAGDQAQSMVYVMDIVVHIKNFTAHPTSRFACDEGGNKPHNFYKGALKNGSQLKLMEA